MKKQLIMFFVLLGFLACGKDDELPEQPIDDNEIYFPPATTTVWNTITPESLNWNASAINELYDFHSENNSRAFIVLKNGEIVIEKYWGKNITNTSSFDQNTNWYWASAGKSLTAFLVGLTQQEGLIGIEDKTSDYLGSNWSSLSLEKENLIKVKHQLTMTSGLDYNVSDLDCTDEDCLQYKDDPGNQWFYHNAPYTLLEKVVSNAAGVTYNKFTDDRLESKIGMAGTWIASGDNNVYWSTARAAARFGLLILNKGKWEYSQILTNTDYFKAMVNSSQDLNPSYGYLWWLNGKKTITYPGLSTSFNTSLAPNAPEDLFAAMGKNGQFIDIVPSENLVVIRFGESPDGSLVPVGFHDEMWQKLEAVRNPD